MTFVRAIGISAAFACALFALAGCSANRATLTPALPATGDSTLNSLLRKNTGYPKIQHVIIVVQENRSFNFLFAGYPKAKTAMSGKTSTGQKVKLLQTSLAAPYEIDHFSKDMFLSCNGTGSLPGTNCKMNGFDKETVDGSAPPDAQYAYAVPAEVAPYWSMAQQYVLGDHMFTSHIDASFVSHQYIIAGQANSAIDLPTTLWGCAGGPSDLVETVTQQRTYGPQQSPCQDYQTLGDEVTNAGLSWHFYSVPSQGTAYVFNGYQAINHIYNGPLWKNIINPPSQFLTDVANGSLANVTWVEPTYDDSDHSGNGSTTGPAWVASVVNAVGESQFWDSSVIFVMWDEWGGWYDPMAPPHVDYDGLGFRVPLLIISPYAKQGVVSHTQFEHGSILRFTEDAFGLAQLAASDTRANDPAVTGELNFKKKPRAFVPIQASLGKQYFLHERMSNHPLDSE